jgi:hypothetical protein
MTCRIFFRLKQSGRLNGRRTLTARNPFPLQLDLKMLKPKTIILGFNPVFTHGYKPLETGSISCFQDVSQQDDESSSCSSVSSNPVPILKANANNINSFSQDYLLSRRQRKLVESRINMENVSREQRPLRR